jgi:hypothetical protein
MTTAAERREARLDIDRAKLDWLTAHRAMTRQVIEFLVRINPPKA